MTTHVGHGNSLEKLILLSAQCSRGLVELTKLPQSGGKFIRANHMIRQPIDCDFHGCTNTGRAIFIDAKSSENRKRLDLSEDHLPQHQRQFLCNTGRMGALAGLIAEARHETLRMVFWVPWSIFSGEAASVAWDDERLTVMGVYGEVLDWQAIMPAVEATR